VFKFDALYQLAIDAMLFCYDKQANKTILILKADRFLSFDELFIFHFNMRKLLDFLTLMRVYFLFQYEKAARFLNFDKGFIFYFKEIYQLSYINIKNKSFVMKNIRE
jgi:hypothetical protein